MFSVNISSCLFVNLCMIYVEFVWPLFGQLRNSKMFYMASHLLETDRQPLLYLGRAQFQNSHLMRWALALLTSNLCE